MKFRRLKNIGNPRPQAIEKHSLYFEMQDAFSSQRYPICFLLDKKEKQYMESIFYEHVKDTMVRKKFRASQVLCAGHVDQLLNYGDALGLAIFANDLVCQLIESDETKLVLPHCLLHLRQIIASEINQELKNDLLRHHHNGLNGFRSTMNSFVNKRYPEAEKEERQLPLRTIQRMVG